MTSPDYTAEEKLAKAKVDAEVGREVEVFNISKYPIMFTRE
jgi:hypothetical protein